MAPVTEMALPIRIETRTGDTPANRRARQKLAPPHLLLTTPESLAVLIASPDAAGFFGSLSAIVMDEVHALAGTKRGDQLALCVERLVELAPVGPARRIVRDRRASGGDPGVHRRGPDHFGRRWCAARAVDHAARRPPVLGRPYGAGGGASGDGAHS